LSGESTGLTEEEVRKKLRITYVGHSMGGMTLPIYLISKANKNEPSNLYHAILMSPAGFHTKQRVTPYLDAIGKCFVYGIAKVTDHFSVPEIIIELGAKLKTELDVMPASRDLISYCSSLVVGGNSSGTTFMQSAQLMRSVLQFGFSMGIPKHIYQLYQSEKFQAFDYGEAMNQRMYGTAEPYAYQDHFDLIGIPITLFISMDDRLIRADDVLRFHETLKAAHPTLARMKVFSGIGHCDFNYLQHEMVRSELTKELQKQINRRIREDKNCQ